MSLKQWEKEYFSPLEAEKEVVMSDTKTVFGPWIVYHKSNGEIMDVCVVDELYEADEIAEEAHIHAGGNVSTHRIAFSTILAIPDLLEACEETRDVLQAWNSMGGVRDSVWAESRIKRLNAAIAKAKGE